LLKLCGKIIKNNTIIQDHVVEMNADGLNGEEMLLKGIEALCNIFDISNPIWMRGNKLEMNQINKTRFKAQHFIDEIDFDYFEIEYIRERV